LIRFTIAPENGLLEAGGGTVPEVDSPTQFTSLIACHGRRNQLESGIAHRKEGAAEAGHIPGHFTVDGEKGGSVDEEGPAEIVGVVRSKSATCQEHFRVTQGSQSGGVLLRGVPDEFTIGCREVAAVSADRATIQAGPVVKKLTCEGFRPRTFCRIDARTSSRVVLNEDAGAYRYSRSFPTEDGTALTVGSLTKGVCAGKGKPFDCRGESLSVVEDYSLMRIQRCPLAIDDCQFRSGG